MITAQRFTLGFAALASLAVAGGHLLTRQNHNIENNNNDLPDFYINSPAWRQFSDQGRLLRRLDADRLEHRGDAHPVLTEPRLTLLDAQKRRWQATARSGQLLEDNRTLVLERQVRLSREPSSAGPVITTEYLRIAGNTNSLETDRAVVIDSGSWHVSGSGLRAELDRKTMELLGEVRGIHE